MTARSLTARGCATADGRVIARDGSASERLFAIGPFTASTETGAFTRPRSDSLALRHTDRVAGAVADAVAVLAHRRGALSR